MVACFDLLKIDLCLRIKKNIQKNAKITICFLWKKEKEFKKKQKQIGNTRCSAKS